MRFFVRMPGDAYPADVVVLEPGDTLVTGEDDIEAWYGDLTTLERDLLRIAAAIFAADRASARGEREAFMGRNIEIAIPVVNGARLSVLTGDLQRLLRILSSDRWLIHLRQIAGVPEPNLAFPEPGGTTLLFSGGIDSLAGAIHLLRVGTPTHLVSHITHNAQTIQAQRSLVGALAARHLTAPHFQIRVSSRDGGPTPLMHAVENSQRTRSFVFLVIGAILARRSGMRQLLMMAENGPFAIHLPLNDARIGAFSTHTADPSFLAGMAIVLSRALSVPFSIENPFLYMTKGEVARIVVNHLPEALPLTVSCWRGARRGGVWHCGECVPCMIRRIAIERSCQDPTHYERDVWSQPIAQLGPDDVGRRNLVDLLEFATRVRDYSEEDIVSTFPDLISEHISLPSAIAMYKRFAAEAHGVFANYQHVQAIA